MSYGDLPTQLDLAQTTFLVGAGLSIDWPSCIPPAVPLADALVYWLCADAPDVMPALRELRRDPGTRDPWQGPFATLRFELLLDWIAYFRHDVLSVLSALDHGGYPNEWHYGLAAAIERGARVLTTNFDTRIEEACDDLGIACPTVVVSRSRPNPEAFRAASLVKLHGTFPVDPRRERKRDAPVGTMTQLARFGIAYARMAALGDVVRHLLESRTVVVSGYSGWDSYDVVPLLESANRERGLLWHDFTPAPGLRIDEPELFDPLVEAAPRHRPADVILTDQRARFPAATWLLAGPTRELFDLLLPRDARRQAAEAAVRMEEALSGETLSVEANLQTLQGLLGHPGYRIDGDVARLAVWGMRNADFRNDEDEDLPLGSSPPAAGDDEDDEPLASSVRSALDREDFVGAARAFLDAVTRREDDQHLDMAFGGVTFWILDRMWSRAFQASRWHQAWRLARLLVHQARRRRSLPAEVHGMFLEAHVHYRWSLEAAKGGAGLRRSPDQYLAKARQLLDGAIHFALRIPQLDTLVAALRLRRWLTTDELNRRRLERAVRVWAPRLALDDEERLLAAFDLLQWAGERGDHPEVTTCIAEIRSLSARLGETATTPGILAVADAYEALLTGVSPDDALAGIQAAAARAPAQLASALESAPARFVS